MSCSCYSREIDKDSPFISNILKKRRSKYDNNNTRQLRIDSIGSVNSINFNGVLNITYKNTKKSNKEESANRILTDLSENYISRRATTNNNINNNTNIINHFPA